MKAIELRDLTKNYGKSRGIASVSLEVAAGEVFGFIGPNGAGKSTTIRTLMGLLRPSSGSVRVLGVDPFAPGGHAVRREIGYLPSEVDYYGEMSSRELLTYHTDLMGMESGAAQRGIAELAEVLELDLSRPISDLSFGNKKKCAIVQALVHEPELLILDEPTSGLDPLMQNRFFDLLEARNKAGVTLFFSSHVLSEIQRMCDRAAIIRDGKITAIEDITSLLSKQMKKVRLVLDGAHQPKLPEGAVNAHWAGMKATFDYVGPPGELLNWLSEQKVLDIALNEPDLESIFMNYYRR